MEEEFKDKVRDAFAKVKDDISFLREELTKHRRMISSLARSIRHLKPTLESVEKLKQENIEVSKELVLKEESSTGNEGVHSFIHADPSYSFNNHALAMDGLNKDIRDLVDGLSKQEFLTFLTLYQLEDEQGFVSYAQLANKLNLSEGCIRTYISTLIKKGVPIVKNKHNNKLIVLSFSPEFKRLGLKKKLIDLFYGRDPEQTSLKQHY